MDYILMLKITRRPQNFLLHKRQNIILRVYSWSIKIISKKEKKKPHRQVNETHLDSFQGSLHKVKVEYKRHKNEDLQSYKLIINNHDLDVILDVKNSSASCEEQTIIVLTSKE